MLHCLALCLIVRVSACTVPYCACVCLHCALLCVCLLTLCLIVRVSACTVPYCECVCWHCALLCVCLLALCLIVRVSADTRQELDEYKATVSVKRRQNGERLWLGSQITRVTANFENLPGKKLWYLYFATRIITVTDRRTRLTIYSYAPHNEVSVNDGPHIRRWSHNIIILTTVLLLPTVFSTVTCCTGL